MLLHTVSVTESIFFLFALEPGTLFRNRGPIQLDSPVLWRIERGSYPHCLSLRATCLGRFADPPPRDATAASLPCHHHRHGSYVWLCSRGGVAFHRWKALNFIIHFSDSNAGSAPPPAPLHTPTPLYPPLHPNNITARLCQHRSQHSTKTSHALCLLYVGVSPRVELE